EGLPASEQDVVGAARDDNPAVLSARFAEQAARHQVRVTTGELLPEVFLTAELLHSENEFSDDSEISQARVLAVVSIPLYQQGFVSSRVRQAKQDASRRRVEIVEARRRVEQDAIDAWEALVTARAQIRSFQSEVRSSEIALEGVREENSVGQRTILDVLDAEQELLDAQVRLVRARRDEVVAAYRIQQVQGRLTAAELGLPVDVYDAEADYLAVRDRWFGLDIPEE
ncbi:MAG: TolC family protein, partial [Kiloniellales bacterium]